MEENNYYDNYDEQFEMLTKAELIQLLVMYVVLGGFWWIYLKIKNIIVRWNKKQ